MSKTASRVVIVIGSRSPATDQVTALLRQGNVRYVLALGARGRRVDMVESMSPTSLSSNVYPEIEEVVTYKCRLPQKYYGVASDGQIVSVAKHNIDDRSPGDFGFDSVLELFFPYSCIGQLLTYLATYEVLSTARQFKTHRGSTPRTNDRLAFHDGQWLVFDKRWWVVPEQLVYAAAGDHCPAAAYAGLCPGVEVQPFADWREKSLVAMHGRDSEKQAITKLFRSQIEYAREELLKAPVVPGTQLRWIHKSIPMIREASLIHQIGYMSILSVPRLDTEDKVVCFTGIAADAKYVASVLAEKLHLHDVYSNPTRGYAGGTIFSKLTVTKWLQDSGLQPRDTTVV